MQKVHCDTPHFKLFFSLLNELRKGTIQIPNPIGNFIYNTGIQLIRETNINKTYSLPNK